MIALRVNRTDPQYGDLARRRSAGSKAIALLRIGARSGPPHHSATAKEYCPSSSAVARHLRYAIDAKTCRSSDASRRVASAGCASHSLNVLP